MQSGTLLNTDQAKYIQDVIGFINKRLTSGPRKERYRFHGRKILNTIPGFIYIGAVFAIGLAIAKNRNAADRIFHQMELVNSTVINATCSALIVHDSYCPKDDPSSHVEPCATLCGDFNTADNTATGLLVGLVFSLFFGIALVGLCLKSLAKIIQLEDNPEFDIYKNNLQDEVYVKLANVIDPALDLNVKHEDDIVKTLKSLQAYKKILQQKQAKNKRHFSVEITVMEESPIQPEDFENRKRQL